MAHGKTSDNKALILEVASRCIAEEGIEQTTTRRLSKLAGVSIGLVPYYIPDRSRLLHQVIDYIFARINEEILAVVEHLPPIERLLSSLEDNYRLFLGHKHYYACVLLSYYYAAFDKEFTEMHTKFYQHNLKRAYALLKAHSLVIDVEKSDESLIQKAQEILDILDGSLMFFVALKEQGSLELYTKNKMNAYRANLADYFK